MANKHKKNEKEDIQQDSEDLKEEKVLADSAIEELVRKVEESEGKYKRALADYQNLEKRVLNEKAEWIRSANKDLILRLLPVLDTIILASSHKESEELKIVIKQFLETLKQEGLERIDTKDKEFDPNTMECIQTMSGEEGKVLQEVRAGYTLYDRVIRPAQVIVGK